MMDPRPDTRPRGALGAMDAVFDHLAATSAGPAVGGQTLLEFGERYFPHYVQQAPSRFHRELCDELMRVLDSPEGERSAIAAPRGHAKSTWVSLIFVLYCIAYRRKNFIVIISNVASLADQMLGDVRAELDDNERLEADFPDLMGEGSMWREDQIVTRNGVRVLALGSGKRIRGRRHRQHRPDLFIFDDLENDEQTRNPEQRNKMADWVTKAVLKSRGLAQKADAVAVGTILHYDAVLARLLDARKSPGWRRKVYRAVVRWSDRQDLWDEWRRLYTDWTQTDDVRLGAAAAFFEANEDAMLAGTEVLWPEAESYLTLQRLVVDEGRTAFDSEKQNEPINPEDCRFREEWFRWFDVQHHQGRVMLVADDITVGLDECDVYVGVDPSMGKRDKHGDPSAIVSVAAYPSQRGEGAEPYRLFWVVDADIRRRHPHVILEDLLAMHLDRNIQVAGIEAVQFQQLFVDEVRQAIDERPEMQDLHVRELKPVTDKLLRIERLEPLVFSGKLRFNRRAATLYEQMRYFPQAAHDDGPDALEMAMSIATSQGWAMLPDAAPEDVREGEVLRDGAASSQLREQVGPEILMAVEGTCGACSHFKADRCTLRQFGTRASAPACDLVDGEMMAG